MGRAKEVLATLETGHRVVPGSPPPDPDPAQPSLYREEIAPNLSAGKTLCFCHGFNVLYGQITPPPDVDVVLFVPNANNPLGCIMPEANKKRLAGLLSRHNVPLIEDDVYGELAYSYPRPRTIKSYDEDGRVLLCSSFSKTLAPGLRIGEVAHRTQMTIADLQRFEDGGGASWAGTFLNARAGTIYAGTSQIQRNIIGEMILQLPKEPKPA